MISGRVAVWIMDRVAFNTSMQRQDDGPQDIVNQYSWLAAELAMRNWLRGAKVPAIDDVLTGEAAGRENTVKELDVFETQSAEMHPDVYAGEDFNDVRPDWHCFAEGDKEGPDSIGDVLNLDAKFFPPGTVVSVKEPLCPVCDGFWIDCKDSDCSFDWDEYARDRYS